MIFFFVKSEKQQRFNQQFYSFRYAQSQKEYDDKRIEVLKQHVFDGKLRIKDSKLRDFSFIENLNIQILDLHGGEIIPKFTCSTVKELRMDQINFENFKNINLENLETLKISNCDLNECEYFSKVIELELDQVKNAEYIFSKQICKTIKKLRVTACSIKSLNSLQLENVEVLHIKGNTPQANNPNILNIENIQTYQHLKDLCLELYDDIDTTPLQQLTNLHTVQFEQCKNIIINFKSESIKDLKLRRCILKSVDYFYLPNLEILGITLGIADQSAVNLDNINQFLNLKELDLSGSQGLDLSVLQDLTQITSLNLSYCNLRDTTNMSEQAIQKLKYIKITSFEEQQNHYIDIAPLKFLAQLEKLNMNYCKLNRIDVLRYLTNLKELDLADNDDIDDITPLCNLFQLRILNLEHCRLTNVEALKLLLNLEELNLARNLNILGLADSDDNYDTQLQNLKELNLADNRNIDNITSLRNLFQPIKLKESCCANQEAMMQIILYQEELNLARKGSNKVIQRTGYLDTTPLQFLTKLTMLNLNLCGKLQLESLSKLTNLDQLYLSSNNLQDLRALNTLQYLTGLTILDLSKCNLSSVNALKTLVNLKELNLNRELSHYELEEIKTPFFDITPLQYLTQLEKLKIIQCGLQSVEALIPLQKLKVLDLRFNLIVYAQPLAQLKQLIELKLLYQNKIIDLSSHFVKYFDLDSKIECIQQPTEQEIQYANILRDVNSPVSLLKNMSEKRKQFKNKAVGKKNNVNMRIKEQNTNMNSFLGKVITLFQQLNAKNIQ
ncbi:Leucine_rich repeats-containing protein [Hexamita inflata]|uniref:Leucine rich repeats-containing protein n=1 Tax=Hexamita inflata TaxID=28002 RepID=A0AA86P6H2_9EUKA|nr:Leucine rich repeats-containing protein [Hexamita inflata]